MAASGDTIAQPFPTPTATPVREPSRPSTQRGEDSSPASSSSPTSPPAQDFPPIWQSSPENTIEDDNNLIPFDPRRFTPTLHANLVSEILSLRREAESKSKTIEELERNLEDSRAENDDLHVNLSKIAKESRSLKSQLQLLEGGSSSALTELAKERDEALGNISDIRKRLEQSQKKARTAEENNERTQLLWDRDRESWASERRNLERKVHVVEGRLKVVLNEIAAAQATGNFSPTSRTEGDGSLREAAATKWRDSVSVRSSAHGARRTSVTSMATDDGDMRDGDRRNPRYSVISITNGQHMDNGSQNLADELALDEEEGFMPFEDDVAPDSPEALPEERPRSVNSVASGNGGMGLKARKILGLALYQSGVADDKGTAMASPVKSSPETRLDYQDSGVQYSPRLSPTPPPEPTDLPPVDPKPKMKDSSTLTISCEMVSSSCQTAAGLHSPPLTPKSIESPQQTAPKIPMVSAFTQTQDMPDADKMTSSPSPTHAPELEIPMIAIHPPGSEPPSPRSSVILPPQTKSVSCQTNFRSIVEGRSIAIQTDVIRIDQFAAKIPASLLPSAIPDLPLSKGSQDRDISPYRPPPSRLGNSVRKTRQRALDSPPMPSKGKSPQPAQAYPGNNDNGPLSEDPKSGIRRPLRSSSLFAGFEEESDEELQSPKSKKNIFSDDEFLNRPLASYTLRRGKLVSTLNQSGLDESSLPEIDEHLAENDSISDFGEAKVHMGPSGGQRPGAAASGSRQQDVRRAAMISSGAAAHQKMRSRSPSDPSIASSGSGIAPPLPVPIRLSSRKFPLIDSDGRQSPTPSATRNFTDRPRPPIVRKPTLRRVRSAAVMSQTDKHARSESGSSQAISNSSYGLESPEHPPLPFDDITIPRERRPAKKPRAHDSRAYEHERQDSSATAIQQTSVVDAIAQTMVGEWMFKYIRRRRSFGVNEAKDTIDGKNPEEVSASITNTGVRHKRWVWLAPYERAIMWSSKQPTSGPALLGKSGRKFVIQSALDVKDDNPLPKGSNPAGQVNRSILILTPQRALKFTATSLERHYVWLTALSFLSHSSMEIRDLDSLPPVPQEEIASPARTPALRKNPIRDSIRVAKGKPRPSPKGKSSFDQQPVVRELPVEELDAADPPNVPRFSKHARKRSNTTGVPRMPALRSFSSHGTMPSSISGSSDANRTAHSGANHGYTSGRSSFSHRMSEASGPPSSVGTGNFFDAIPTVRMEAFIDRTNTNRYPAHRSQKSPGPWSPQFDVDFGPGKESSEMSRHEDPFHGF